MLKTNSRGHQALNRILNLAEGWVPLTVPHCHPPLSLAKVRVWGRGGLFDCKIRNGKGLCGCKGLWWGKPKLLLVRTASPAPRIVSIIVPEKEGLGSPSPRSSLGVLSIERFRKKLGTTSTQQLFQLLDSRRKGKMSFRLVSSSVALRVAEKNWEERRRPRWGSWSGQTGSVSIFPAYFPHDLRQVINLACLSRSFHKTRSTVGY